MKQEDYVSFNVTKLLKKKGYNEKCSSLYLSNGIFIQNMYECKGFEKKIEDGFCDAPSLWDAQKWLREKHNISVEVYATASGWKWSICKACKDVTGGTKITSSWYNINEELMNDCGSYDTYEAALNSGIKEALNRL